MFKCTVQLDILAVECEQLVVRAGEGIFVRVTLLDQAAETGLVRPSFPLEFHERIQFVKMFKNVKSLDDVSRYFKKSSVILQLIQKFEDEKLTIAHCSCNSHDFLYPEVPTGCTNKREIFLHDAPCLIAVKRKADEPLRLIFTSKIKLEEVLFDQDDKVPINSQIPQSDDKLSRSLPSPSASSTVKDPGSKPLFWVRKSDTRLLNNRDFSSFSRPRPRSPSPQKDRSPPSRGGNPSSPSRDQCSLPSRRSEPESPIVPVSSVPRWDGLRELSISPKTPLPRAAVGPSRRQVQEYVSAPRSSAAGVDEGYVDSDGVDSEFCESSPLSLDRLMDSSERMKLRIDSIIAKRERILSGSVDDLTADRIRERLAETQHALAALKLSDASFRRRVKRLPPSSSVVYQS